MKNTDKKLTPLGDGPEKDFNEEHWFHYSILGKDELYQSPIKDEIIAYVDGDEQLAMVLNHWFGKEYKKWMESIVPAMEGITGAECLKSEQGRRRLYTVLMRMR